MFIASYLKHATFQKLDTCGMHLSQNLSDWALSTITDSCGSAYLKEGCLMRLSPSIPLRKVKKQVKDNDQAFLLDTMTR